MKFIVIFSLILIMPDQLAYSDNNIFINESAKAGHRNLGLIERGDTLCVTYWPLGFRDDYEAFRDIRQRVIRFIEQKPDSEINNIELIQTSWGIPVIQADFVKNSQLNEFKFKRAFKSRYSTSLKNSFHKSRRFLVQFDIPLNMTFGGFQDPLVFKTGIRSDFRLMVYQGIIAYGQVDFYVHNEYDPQMWYKPANLGVMFARAFGEKILSITNIGTFMHKDIYGIDEEIRFSLFDDESYLGLHLGIYGDMWFKDNRFTYYNNLKPDKKLAIGSFSWSYDRYDCSIKLMGGRFLNGDKGAGIGISRIFHEVEIGFSGIYSADEFNGYINFSIPLFPKSRNSLSSYGLGPVRKLRYSYRYNSKTVTHDPEETAKGIEPEAGISFGEIEDLAKPVHFRNMSRVPD